MKILHLADLHIGKKVNGFSMIEEQRNIMKQIKDIAIEKNVSVIMIAGDVYDKITPPAEAVSLFDEFLTDIVKQNINIMIISGNHDSIERLSFASSIMQNSGVYIAKQITDTPKKVRLEDEFGYINFYLLPFIRPIDVKSIYPDENIIDYNQAVKKITSQINLNKKDRNIILAHQFITDCETSDSEILSVGGLDNVDADVFKDFDYTALGHIHKPQKISEKIRYAGSILKYSFSECKINKSVPVINLQEKGNMSVELIPLKPIHDLIEIKGKYNELMSPEFYKNINNQDYIRAILTDDIPEPDAAAKLRTIYPNIMKVDYDNISLYHDCVIDSEEEIDNLKPIEFIKQFYEEMLGKSMNDKQEKYLEDLIEEVWSRNETT